MRRGYSSRGVPEIRSAADGRTPEAEGCSSCGRPTSKELTKVQRWIIVPLIGLPLGLVWFKYMQDLVEWVISG
jgi:hypothetical protein